MDDHGVHVVNVVCCKVPYCTASRVGPRSGAAVDKIYLYSNAQPVSGLNPCTALFYLYMLFTSSTRLAEPAHHAHPPYGTRDLLLAELPPLERRREVGGVLCSHVGHAAAADRDDIRVVLTPACVQSRLVHGRLAPGVV
jgi:hypothetical protein